MKENAPDQFDQAYASISEGVASGISEREQAMMLHEEVDLWSWELCASVPGPAQAHVADALKFFDGITIRARGTTLSLPNHVHAIVTPARRVRNSKTCWGRLRIFFPAGGKLARGSVTRVSPQGRSRTSLGSGKHESYDRIIRGRP